jgi:hypothetical protein
VHITVNQFNAEHIISELLNVRDVEAEGVEGRAARPARARPGLRVSKIRNVDHRDLPRYGFALLITYHSCT